PIGLTYTQYVMFLVLWEKDGITIGQLCKKLFLDNGTITPIIKKMQKAGYIERYRNPEDDRVVLIYLTEKGQNLQQKVKDIPKKIISCIELSDMKKKQLYDILYKLLDGQSKK
ncbi:MAG: MarR family transcriptional regulator, partial [Anaerovoracaceae bacterium]|nr:MarR family transcriptional regulator [Anaerovoracaceae bacterium]